MKLRLFILTMISAGGLHPVQAVFEERGLDDNRERLRTSATQKSVTEQNALDPFLPDEAQELQTLIAMLKSYEGQPLTPKTLKKKAALRFEISRRMKR
jgi:hypothetical protein